MSEIFGSEELQELDFTELGMALNETDTRILWFQDVLEEIKRINLEVDRRLRAGNTELRDLSARRIAIQDVLELAIAARRKARKPIPQPQSAPGFVNLDRTV